VKELIEAIKKEPGKHSYASAGVGSTPHLQGEMFRLAFGLDMVHVPFGGGGPALQSAVAGHTPIAFAALPPAIPLIKSGHLRALAVIGPKGVSALPGVPTMTEAGLPGQETETVLLVLAPAGTSKAIVNRLHRELVDIIAIRRSSRNSKRLVSLRWGRRPRIPRRGSRPSSICGQRSSATRRFNRSVADFTLLSALRASDLAAVVGPMQERLALPRAAGQVARLAVPLDLPDMPAYGFHR
jgi:hypothetical protein